MADADQAHYDERVAHVAVHRKPEPPRTVEEWRVWEDACIQTNRRDLLPGDSIRINWPEGYEPEVGPGWIPLAEDHPFKGRDFCWRCLAEASGFPTGDAPHRRVDICFEADGDPDAEDDQQDASEAFRRETVDQTSIGPIDEPPWSIGADGRHQYADPSRPALAGEAEHRVWWQAGASIVSEDRPTDFTDSGTLFPEGGTR